MFAKHGTGIDERSSNVGMLTVAKAQGIMNTLLECGFISNQGEALELSTPAYQQVIGTNIANIIIEGSTIKKYY